MGNNLFETWRPKRPVSAAAIAADPDRQKMTLLSFAGVGYFHWRNRFLCQAVFAKNFGVKLVKLIACKRREKSFLKCQIFGSSVKAISVASPIIS